MKIKATPLFFRSLPNEAQIIDAAIFMARSSNDVSNGS
jgi:hypothetical protein